MYLTNLLRSLTTITNGENKSPDPVPIKVRMQQAAGRTNNRINGVPKAIISIDAADIPTKIAVSKFEVIFEIINGNVGV